MQEKEKSTGHIVSCNILLDEPQMKIENMAINKLNLMVGINGAGKTFTLVTMWFFAYVASAIALSLRTHVYDYKQIAQHALDNCFDNKQITGKMDVTFESESQIIMVLNKGNIDIFDYKNFEGITNATAVKFMSSAMRTFEAMGMYLKFRKIIVASGVGNDVMIEELLKTFKLYDVLQMESMIMRMPYNITPELKSSLESFDIQDNFLCFNVDLDKGEFYAVIDKPGNIKNLSTYGKGHQSIINMMLSNALS